jgi:uncharacterized protein YbdZ (MbtH family)
MGCFISHEYLQGGGDGRSEAVGLRERMLPKPAGPLITRLARTWSAGTSLHERQDLAIAVVQRTVPRWRAFVPLPAGWAVRQAASGTSASRIAAQSSLRLCLGRLRTGSFAKSELNRVTQPVTRSMHRKGSTA